MIHRQPEKSQPVPVGRFLPHGNFDLNTKRYSPGLVDGVSQSRLWYPWFALRDPTGVPKVYNGRLFLLGWPPRPMYSSR